MLKRFFTTLFLLLALSSTAMAQGYKFSSVSFGSGQTPISGGVSVSVDLTDDSGGFIQIMAQSEQAWFMMGKDWSTERYTCSLYGSIGHFQSAPWVGPYAGCNLNLIKVGGQTVSIGALTWPGFYIGREPDFWREDGKENPESLLAGYYSSAQVNIGGVSMSLSHLNFLDEETNWLPGVAYTQKVRADLVMSSSVTWNTNARSPMFFIGATWRPE